MPQFVIERDMPGVGGLGSDDLKGASQKSCSVLRDLGPEVQWVHSYVRGDFRSSRPRSGFRREQAAVQSQTQPPPDVASWTYSSIRS